MNPNLLPIFNSNTVAKKFQENSNNSPPYKQTHKQQHPYKDQIDNDSNSLLNSPLTFKKISSILTLIQNSAPGPDNIPKLLLKILSNVSNKLPIKDLQLYMDPQSFC